MQIKENGIKISFNQKFSVNPFDFSLKLDDKISFVKSHGIKTGRRVFDSYVSQVGGDIDKIHNKREDYSKKSWTMNIQTVDSPVILRKITQLSKSMKLQEGIFQWNLKKTWKNLNKYWVLKNID